MTVSSTTNKIIYNGLTGQSVFAYNFRVDQKSDMQVYLAGVIIPDTDWTIDGLGDDGGGNVTLNDVLASDQTVTLLREVDETQLVDYQPFDAFPAETHEDALDKLTFLTQQLQEQVDRGVSLPVDTTLDGYDVGTPVANMVIQYKPDETGQESSGIDATSFNANVQSAADSAAAAFASEQKSQDWAENPEDVPVETSPDQFSAFHWAQKSEAFTNWDQFLDGYDAASRRHFEYSSDLDLILINSKYYIDSTTVTNEPADFIGTGVIETDMWVTDPTQAVQILVSMDDANNGKAWIRNLETSVWSSWKPFGAGGATILDTPPANPNVGDSWWSSITGKSYIYYDDGDSTQWVEQEPGEPSSGGVLSTGMVAPFAVDSVAGDWLFCDGSAVSRTTYANLFSKIGITYGAGDASTTFNLPDYRGEFLRGQDVGAAVDPEAGTRIDRGDGVTGDFVGTKQDEDFLSHTHTHDQSSYTSSGNTSRTRPETGAGALVTGATGGLETRPVNTYVRYYIFAGLTLAVLDSTKTFTAYSRVTSVGVISHDTGHLTVALGGTGVIEYTFVNPQVDDEYQVQATPFSNSAGRLLQVFNQDEFGFEVLGFNTAGTAAGMTQNVLVTRLGTPIL